jgi:hypothetical protein
MASNINASNIDTTFPIAGQDNDTQGFRTNYINIKNNFVTAATEITTLQAAQFATTYTNSNVAAYLPTYTGNITANAVTLTSAIQFASLSPIQISAINPTRGMTVYNYISGNIQVYNGTKWANVTLS